MSNLPPGVTDADIDNAAGADCEEFEFILRVTVWAPDYDSAVDTIKCYDFEIKDMELV